MYRRCVFLVLSFLLALSVTGCGGLRYNVVLPEARGFHPGRIVVLPVGVGSYAEAQGIIDQAVVDALIEKEWFSRVVSADTLMKQSGTNQELRDAVTAYLEKLEKLNYSDPELSRKIGGISQADALLIVSLDYWNYIKEGDTKVAKVGLGIRMADAATGKLVWEARHIRAEKYLVIRPGLPDVAKSLTKEMARYMPR